MVLSNIQLDEETKMEKKLVLLMTWLKEIIFR